MTAATDRSPHTLRDRLIALQGGWEQFKLIQRGCEYAPGVRLFYFDGTIEILMPGQLHETFSRTIGWMLTYFLAAKQISFTPTGSVTQEREGEVSVQADESYCIGTVKSIPDLSIEVIFTRDSIDKLERYRVLGVPEVWFWKDGTLALYRLREKGYEPINRSELPGLVDLDLNLLQRCILIAETNAMEAVTVFARSIGTL